MFVCLKIFLVPGVSVHGFVSQSTFTIIPAEKKFKTYFANLLKFNTFLPVLHYNGRPRTFWGLSKVKYPGENLSFNNYQKKFH